MQNCINRIKIAERNVVHFIQLNKKDVSYASFEYHLYSK